MPSVLLIDDDLNLLRGLRRCLRDQPYDLYTAHNAEIAMDMFRRRAFDLIVVDQNMDAVKGTDLMAWINQSFPNTVRIMLTGSSDHHVMIDAINNGGVFRFLTKPCREFELALAILDGLEQRYQLQSSND